MSLDNPAQNALTQRLDVLAELGRYMLQDTPQRQAAIRGAEQHNGWFTAANSLLMIRSIAKDWLTASALQNFASVYEARILAAQPNTICVGLVLAGNIPLVGLHDVICCYISGCDMQIKLSDKDTILMTWVLDFIRKNSPQSAGVQIEIVEQLRQPMHKVIATGSDNSALHFEQYFGKYPNIIRKNRNSIAILTGKETEADYMALGLDIFRFFGLGCRSVSKLYVPKDFDFVPLMRQLDHYKDIINHTKYCNNFDYNRSIYLINSVHHYINDCLILLESPSALSRIATLHYEFYSGNLDLSERIAADLKHLQCGVAAESTRIALLAFEALDNFALLPFGQSQRPLLSDFADNVDTMQFLLS